MCIVFRFIDDLNKKFTVKYLKVTLVIYTYPEELEPRKENDNNAGANFLNLDIKIKNNISFK